MCRLFHWWWIELRIAIERKLWARGYWRRILSRCGVSFARDSRKTGCLMWSLPISAYPVSLAMTCSTLYFQRQRRFPSSRPRTRWHLDGGTSDSRRRLRFYREAFCQWALNRDATKRTIEKTPADLGKPWINAHSKLTKTLGPESLVILSPDWASLCDYPCRWHQRRYLVIWRDRHR